MPATDADYDALGLRRPASEPQARAAFRRLALRLHPDKNGGCRRAEAEFTRVSLAYRAVLEDIERGGGAGTGGESGSGFGGGPEARACARVVGDAVRSLLVWWLVASASAADDIELELEVPLADACVARVKRLQIAVMRRAAHAGRWSELCRVSQVVYVRIDAACARPGGGVFRFPGAGDDPVLPVGRRGDVVVTVRLLPHPTLRPDTVYSCLDLHVDVPVTPRDYYYGADVEVPHEDGAPPVAVRYRGASGRRVHVEPGRGLADVASGKRGDLYVFFELRMPELDPAFLAAPRVRQAFDAIFG